MELTQYIRLFRKWFWLLALAAFLAGSAGFIVSSRRQPVYEAQVTLFVGGFIQDPDPGTSDISTGQQLAETYSALATTYDIALASVEAGNFPVSPDGLRSRIKTTIRPNTSLIVLSVTYTDPVLTADMANQVAEQLIANSPSNLTNDEQAQVDALTEQLGNVQQQLRITQEELIEVDAQLAEESDIETTVNLNARRDILVDRVTNLSSTLAELSTSIQTLQRRTNRLAIVERARIPTDPTGLSAVRTTMLAAAVGLALAIGGVLLIEYLNDTFRTPEEVTSTLGLAVLGTIFKFGKNNEDYSKKLITHLHPTSPVTEGYRTLRTNLIHSPNNTGDIPQNIFVITSPGPEEGKSVTVANLAVALATDGKNVLLIDADLRRPKQHNIFGLDNEVGLTTLLFSNPQSLVNDPDEMHRKVNKCIQQTSIARLGIMTSGFLPSNPAEILGASNLKLWYEWIVDSLDVDVVLFDTPPTLVVADAAVLAATLKAPILLILRAGKTRRNAAFRAKEQLETVGIEIAGTAMNYVDPSDQGYGYGETYYYYYADTEGYGFGTQSRLKQLLGRLTRKHPE